ncbi:hypothetical protein E2320_009441, partial [Naja naja]
EIHQSLACLQGGIFKKVLGGWVAWRPRPRRPVEATWSNNHPHLSSSSPRHPILCNLGAFGDRCFLVFHCSSPDLATGLQFPSQGEVKTSEGRRTTKLLPMAAVKSEPSLKGAPRGQASHDLWLRDSNSCPLSASNFLGDDFQLLKTVPPPAFASYCFIVRCNCEYILISSLLRMFFPSMFFSCTPYES